MSSFRERLEAAAKAQKEDESKVQALLLKFAGHVQTLHKSFAEYFRDNKLFTVTYREMAVAMPTKIGEPVQIKMQMMEIIHGGINLQIQPGIVPMGQDGTGMFIPCLYFSNSRNVMFSVDSMLYYDETNTWIYKTENHHSWWTARKYLPAGQEQLEQFLERVFIVR